MRGRAKGSVQIDRYALENVMTARETNASEVSQKLGRSKAYLSQVFLAGGYMKPTDFENLKGLLRVTDSDIVKAVPVQRADEVESIYQPRPVYKCDKYSVVISEENYEFIELLQKFGGGEKNTIVNAIIKEFRATSPIAHTLNDALEMVKTITE